MKPAVISFQPRAEWAKEFARRIVAEIRLLNSDEEKIIRIEHMLSFDDDERPRSGGH